MNAQLTPQSASRESTLSHLVTATLYTVATVVVFGLLYPAAIALIGAGLFPYQAAGSLVRDARGTVIGSALVGQRFSKERYFHGRPSAAGKDGYDPTATGGTNLAPTSHKLVDATRHLIVELRRGEPASHVPPIDLVTSSGSGIDPDISPEAAIYQASRVARERHLPLDVVRHLVSAHVVPRTVGFLGEPRVNVFELNRALDALR